MQGSVMPSINISLGNYVALADANLLSYFIKYIYSFQTFYKGNYYVKNTLNNDFTYGTLLSS